MRAADLTSFVIMGSVLHWWCSGRAGIYGPVRAAVARPRPAVPGDFLLADAEPLDQLGVAVGVLALQVVEQAAALADQLQEPAAGVMILDVCLEMFGQVVDAFAEERDLNLGGAGVGVVRAIAPMTSVFPLFVSHDALHERPRARWVRDRIAVPCRRIGDGHKDSDVIQDDDRMQNRPGQRPMPIKPVGPSTRRDPAAPEGSTSVPPTCSGPLIAGGPRSRPWPSPGPPAGRAARHRSGDHAVAATSGRPAVRPPRADGVATSKLAGCGPAQRVEMRAAPKRWPRSRASDRT